MKQIQIIESAFTGTTASYRKRKTFPSTNYPNNVAAILPASSWKNVSLVALSKIQLGDAQSAGHA